MSNNVELSIIIPAYNEQDRIVPTLKNTISYLEKSSIYSQIIVVSDGSTDNTSTVAKHFEPKDNIRLNVMEYHPNRGKGYAVRYGMLRALGNVCMFMDADYAVPIEYCEKGLSLIASGYDVAIGSRAISGSVITSHQNIVRFLSAKIYTFIQNCYLNLNFPDTQCGFKLFSYPVAKDLFDRQKLHSVIFDPEILWLAKYAGYSIGQFPVQWSHIADSRIQYDNIGKSLFIFQELLRIKRLHRNSG